MPAHIHTHFKKTELYATAGVAISAEAPNLRFKVWKGMEGYCTCRCCRVRKKPKKPDNPNSTKVQFVKKVNHCSGRTPKPSPAGARASVVSVEKYALKEPKGV